MNAVRKNKSTNRGTNKKMNNDVYKQRRQVMDFIYRAKNLLKDNNIQLPRIDIRIIDLTKEAAGRGVLGVARMNDNIVWIPETTLNKKSLHAVVFHEIIHAALGIDHIKSCKLMNAYIPVENDLLTSDKVDQIFLSYFKRVK